MPEYILHNRLKVARAERNLSQTQLANMAGVTRQTIGAIETGQYAPSAKLAFIICKVLNKRIDDVFYLTEEDTEEDNEFE